MAQLIEVGDGQYKLTGQISFQQVPELWQSSCRIFPKVKSPSVSFNVDEITQIDSGGLAFLVSWARWASFNDKQFSIKGENSQLSALIENNQLQPLLMR